MLTSRQSKAAARIGVPTLGNSQRNGAGNRQNQRERWKFNVAEILSYKEPFLSSGRHRSFVLNELYVSPWMLSNLLSSLSRSSAFIDAHIAKWESAMTTKPNTVSFGRLQQPHSFGQPCPIAADVVTLLFYHAPRFVLLLTPVCARCPGALERRRRCSCSQS